MTFALVTEGISEHKIIKHILSKYFKEEEPDINQMQPLLTDNEKKQKESGGWAEVLNYCGDEKELESIFIENDYLVVQIDTDMCEIEPFSVSRQSKNDIQLCDDVIGRLKEIMPQSIQKKFSDRILYAICINTIECWLLPLYYNDSHRCKTTNCLRHLNAALAKKNMDTISSEGKNSPNSQRAYERILKEMKRSKDIENYSQYNHGFNSFVAQLKQIKAPALFSKNDLRIAYMGTPTFALQPLRALVEGGYNIVGIITMPDKPAGRGHKLQYSPIKEYALEKGLPLLQPEKLKDETFIEALRAWKADLQIVVAFRMLPEVVWNMPPLGTFNLHASLLPQYRGAAPINWAVINGETETGITTFFLTHEIDTGKVIQQVHVPIADTDDVGIVHDKLMMLGAELVVETVDHIIAGTVKPVSQEEMKVEGELHPAPKIFKETCRIDWNQPVKRIYDFIRGLSPSPGAWAEMQLSANEQTVVKIFAGAKVIEPHSLKPGTILTDNKTYIKVAAADGFVNIKQLQLPGKKRMAVEELLRGYKICVIS